MKIVKRVSLFKSVNRLSDPAPYSFKMTRMQWKNTAPYRLTTQQELYRTGYRNYRHSGILATAAITAFLLGTFVDASEKALADVLHSHSERAINSVPIPASRKIAFRLLADPEDDFWVYTERSDSGKYLPCS